MSYEVIHTDVIEWAKEYAGKPFAVILCDPPYHLTSIVKRYGKPGSAPAQYGRDGAFQRVSSGFMGASWDGETDGVGIAFQKETWAALAKHLLPGGFIVAFASSRGWHRLACALEDAGLIIQPSIFNWHSRQAMEVPFCLGWACGQSFPKATSIDKQLDRAANATGQRKKVGKYELPGQKTWNLKQDTCASIEAVGGAFTASGKRTLTIEEPATELGCTWAGHRYGGQILKNALEPIIIAQKPYEDVPSDVWATFSGWHWWHYPKKIKNTPKERLRLWKKYGVHIPPADVEYDLWFIKRRALHKGIESDILLVWRDRRQDRLRPTPERTLYRGNVKKYRRWKIKNKSACIAVTGAGAFWIEGARIGTDTITTHGKRVGTGTSLEWSKYDNWVGGQRQGRWPASLTLTHVPPDENGNGGCVRLGTKRVRGHKGYPNGPGGLWSKEYQHTSPIAEAWNKTATEADNEAWGGYADPEGLEAVADWKCVPECPVRKLGEQSGERVGGRPITNPAVPSTSSVYYEYPQRSLARSGRGDTGTASRFFFQAAWHYEVAERLAQASPVRYCAKASRKERNVGCERLEPKQQTAQGSRTFNDRCGNCGKKFIGPPDKICSCGNPITDKTVYKNRNPHPTVKPITLCKWLATLLLPPPEYAPRRIAIPFGGTGSEGIGAMLAGWEEIVIIEREAEYIPIAKARCKFWETKMQTMGLDEPREILKMQAVIEAEQRREERQMMFGIEETE